MLGYSRFHANFARSNAPRDVLFDNLDLCAIRDMLLLLKVEIERCIERLEMVLGFRGFGRGVGCVRAPSNQSDALGQNIPGPSIVV